MQENGLGLKQCWWWGRVAQCADPVAYFPALRMSLSKKEWAMPGIMR